LREDASFFCPDMLTRGVVPNRRRTSRRRDASALVPPPSAPQREDRKRVARAAGLLIEPLLRAAFYRVRARPATGSPAPIERSAYSRSPLPPSPATTCQRICKGRSLASPTRRSRSPAFLRARRSAKSRSIPRRAGCKWCATLPSTMSGVRSTR